MSRQPQTIRQGDVSRAVKAVQAAGVKVARVEIDSATGRIAVIADDSRSPTDVERSALDRWRDVRGTR